MSLLNALNYTQNYSNAVNWSLVLVRIAGGGFMLSHGYGKLLQLLDGDAAFGDPIGIGPQTSLALAVFAEFLCALLVLIGLFARWASIPLIITMLVAVGIVHAGQEFGNKELGLFYLIANAVILLSGPGKFSLDYLRQRR